MARLTPLGVVAATLALLCGSAHPATLPSIYVNYSDSCTFTMSADGGITLASAAAPGTVIPPGEYQLVLTAPKNAPSCPMDFRLTGPGVQLEWNFGGEALDANATETLQPSSTYIATDVANQSRGYVVFSTSAAGSSSSLVTTAPSTATGKGQTLQDLVGSARVTDRGGAAITISSAGGLAVTAHGRRATTLPAGRYRLTITDRSPKTGLSLTRGHSRRSLTGAAFVGRKTATVVLAAGSRLTSGAAAVRVR